MPTKKKKKSVKKATPKKAILTEYDIASRTHERRAALQKDAGDWGTLKILKHLNQIREAQLWNPRAHEIMTRDLEYLEKAYQRGKAQN